MCVVFCQLLSSHLWCLFAFQVKSLPTTDTCVCVHHAALPLRHVSWCIWQVRYSQLATFEEFWSNPWFEVKKGIAEKKSLFIANWLQYVIWLLGVLFSSSFDIPSSQGKTPRIKTPSLSIIWLLQPLITSVCVCVCAMMMMIILKAPHHGMMCHRARNYKAYQWILHNYGTEYVTDIVFNIKHQTSLHVSKHV